MVQVVIQPSFGNADAQRHWADTIAQEVRFNDEDLRATLNPEQVSALQAMHPSGKARFWGAVASHDNRMSSLATGDIVLFTGKKHVRGVGEVGVSFRNARTADVLWTAHADRGSYHNVYSLRAFEPTLIPYEEIWALPGFNSGDNFMGTRFVTDERAGYLLEGLGIQTDTERVREARAERDLTQTLERARGRTSVIPGEAYNVETTSYEAPARTTLVRRNESLLVNAYVEYLDVIHERTSTPVGLTDVYLASAAGGYELIEAKSNTSRRHVREAVGQLLDYAPHCATLTSIAVLLPERPNQSAIAYAHRYGIDVIHRTPQGSFDRVPAPHAARLAILSLAGHTPPGQGLASPALDSGTTAMRAPTTQATRTAPTPATMRGARSASHQGPGIGR